ncbi:BNR-4 repeat-containing protein [Gilvimarinus sp. DA14]|uniref:BNR-4 repeat-containing protein n=1 Tax=Gilvimarinus sp. DA14 TaxID=2956798 RepID=UPI0020B8FD81|nr:BNR-4 repeat-containing protein [Gilvimarinus sp. DA14]UTF60176.1 BNR-4 repeat-containing protein [Gilvimarinus sp. DA14]
MKPTRIKPILVRSAILLAVLLTLMQAKADDTESVHTARLVPLTAEAYAGSSVNVVAGAQPLYTDSVHQYAAFYNTDAKLVLAKRRMGEDDWDTSVTPFSGNVKDAHNSISLIVDGEGYLHLAWDHHNNPLNYAVSEQPGSLSLNRASMLDNRQSSVTYPQFLRLPSGDLLLSYRDGGSGKGNLVLNRYHTKTGQWQRVQNNLISGEGQRSAYWDLTVDSQGGLHLAWIWRETPDVASNHDLLYAFSADGGQTWQNSAAKPYKLPITAQTAEVAAAVAQKSNLMNPPRVATDRLGKPYIVSYWSPAEGQPPAFHLVYQSDNGWTTLKGPAAGENFTLAGWGTKRPPISRASLLIEYDWDKSWAHIIYRDDTAGGRVIIATANDLTKPEWHKRFLTEQSVGAWEPNIDPAQWARLKQAHLLVQNVRQLDGDDSRGAGSAGAPIDVLMFKPDWESHQAREAAGDTAIVKRQEPKPIDPSQVSELAQRVADWQWANMPDGWHFHPQGWGVCPLYIGMLDMDPYLPQGQLQERLAQRGRELNFAPRDNNPFDADDYCVSQAWIRLYQDSGDKAMLTPSKQWLDNILQNPPSHSLDWGYGHSRHRWSWSDSLFMGPMAWVLMWEATGDDKYLDFMNREWWATTERLYRSDIGLYFRDESYLDVREQNGKTVHWARGTSWVIAGLAQVLEHLPQDYPDYPRYKALFEEMSAAFLAAQQGDGLWRPGLLDPDTHNARETSGSGFIAFAFASGINQGLLPAETYLPAVQKTWAALTDSVLENGKLTQVQPVGAGPHGFDPNNAAPFASGALLMLASELMELTPSASD